MSEDRRAAVTSSLSTGHLGSKSAWFVVLGMLCGYFALLVALGGHDHWRTLGVPAVDPAFLDLRSVTSGWDCVREYGNTWPGNPCDPYGRPENNPRMWIAASVIGLGQDDTEIIGFTLAVVFLVTAILVLSPRAPLWDAVIYGLALCSPAVMMGVERGNVDIGLFCLVAAAALVLRRVPYGPPVASGLVLASAVLKLFPIAAVGMLARLPRRLALICVPSVVGLFAIYVAATFRDIQTIERVLPQTDDDTYGMHILGGWLGRLSGAGRVWDTALIILAITLALAFRRTLQDRLDTGPVRELDLFWAGAGIYVATFALGRSSDYRLVFLLLTIPQLARWTSARRALPIATLCGVLLTLWLLSPWTEAAFLEGWGDLTRAGGRPLPIASPPQVIAFVGLTCLLVATLPNRLAERVHDDPEVAAPRIDEREGAR